MKDACHLLGQLVAPPPPLVPEPACLQDPSQVLDWTSGAPVPTSVSFIEVFHQADLSGLNPHLPQLDVLALVDCTLTSAFLERAFAAVRTFIFIESSADNEVDVEPYFTHKKCVVGPESRYFATRSRTETELMRKKFEAFNFYLNQSLEFRYGAVVSEQTLWS